MKNTSKIVYGICVIVIFVAFFLPWVNVHSAPLGGITKLIAGKEAGPLYMISAYQVPIMANGPDSRLMISVIKIFKPQITDADKKSWAIWGIPLFAVLMGAIGVLMKENEIKKWVYLAFGIVGCAIFAVAVFKIKTTDLDKMVLQITMGRGLWLTLWGFFVMGLVSFYNFGMKFLKKA
ncbi:MAG: hypothetical protein P9M07_06740 [Candidatus Aceula meridiana]|nr:hypothetical protein [Candidatus Aceula meridiana]